MLNLGNPDRIPAEEAEVATGRLRMSLIPWGVAAKYCWCDRKEESPGDGLIPGEDTGIPPGFGEVEDGEDDDVGPVLDKG